MCVNTAVSCNWVLFAMPWQAFAGDEGRFDPGSTNTFTRVHDCTVEIVLPTMMLSGKSRTLVGKGCYDVPWTVGFLAGFSTGKKANLTVESNMGVD